VSALETRLSAALLATSDVVHLSSFVRSPNGRLLVTTLDPASGPQSEATTSLFDRLVGTTLPRTLAGTQDRGYVTGEAPSQVQFDQLIAQRIPLIIAVVVLLAFFLIMTVFRSLLLALKAALLNLFSIAAAYGVLVAVFQWGWGRTWLGMNENVPIEAYVPMVLFAIVFGLSMDYEIFLLSRVKETWELTHDNHESVAEGLARTGRVITAAALIMVAVFLSFVTTDLVAIKQLAVGLAASVAIDATLIRLLLVPATMYLFGDKNWWLPRRWDVILPHVTID
jgi:RND superfamily putative drug exporter